MKPFLVLFALLAVSCGKKKIESRILSDAEKSFLPYSLGQKLVFKNLNNSSLKTFYVNFIEDEIVHAETNNGNIVLNGYSKNVEYNTSVFRMTITDSVYFGDQLKMEPAYSYNGHTQKTYLHGSFNKFTFENVILDQFLIDSLEVNGITYQKVIKIDSTVYSYKYGNTKTLYIAQNKGIVRWDEKNGDIYEIQP